MKTAWLAVFLAGVSACAQAQQVFEGFISINGDYYQTDFDAGLPDFNGQTFTINFGDKLELAGDVKTIPSGEGDNTFGMDVVRLVYRISDMGVGRPGMQTYGFESNVDTALGRADKWSAAASGNPIPDIMAGFGPGTYGLAVQWGARDEDNNIDAGLGSGFVDYSATVIVVPEPATLSLLGAGVLGLAARRRARALLP